MYLLLTILFTIELYAHIDISKIKKCSTTKFFNFNRKEGQDICLSNFPSKLSILICLTKSLFKLKMASFTSYEQKFKQVWYLEIIFPNRSE